MLETLTQLVPPPRLPLVTSPFGETGFERTWEEAEEVLEVSFPDDHKQVVEHYGDGLWGGSLVLITPRFCNVYRNTVEITTSSHLFTPRGAPLSDDPRYLKAFFNCKQAACNIHVASPYEFYPSNPGLLPLGYVGDNYLGVNPRGCYLFWRTSQDREIVVLSNNHTFHSYQQGLCSFLVNVFQGAIDLGGPVDVTRGFQSWWRPRNGSG